MIVSYRWRHFLPHLEQSPYILGCLNSGASSSYMGIGGGGIWFFSFLFQSQNMFSEIQKLRWISKLVDLSLFCPASLSFKTEQKFSESLPETQFYGFTISLSISWLSPHLQTLVDGRCASPCGNASILDSVVSLCMIFHLHFHLSFVPPSANSVGRCAWTAVAMPPHLIRSGHNQACQC